MNNLVVVAIDHCRQDLIHGLSSLLLTELSKFHNSVEQFPSTAELSHDVQILVILEVLVNLDNVWMVLNKS